MGRHYIWDHNGVLRKTGQAAHNQAMAGIGDGRAKEQCLHNMGESGYLYEMGPWLGHSIK